MGIHIMPPLYKMVITPPPEEVTEIFYPDAHPEVTSFDGNVARGLGAEGEDWGVIHAGAGTTFGDDTETAGFGFYAAGPSYPNKYVGITRMALLFDISSIAGRTIQSAILTVVGHRLRLDFSYHIACNVYESFPLSNTEIEAADYQNFNNVAFSAPIQDDSFKIDDDNIFTLNASAITYLQSILANNGIAKLALREAYFDAPNNIPPWESGNQYASFHIKMAESGAPNRPRLEVTYQ